MISKWDCTYFVHGICSEGVATWRISQKADYWLRQTDQLQEGHDIHAPETTQIRCLIEKEMCFCMPTMDSVSQNLKETNRNVFNCACLLSLWVTNEEEGRLLHSGVVEGSKPDGGGDQVHRDHHLPVLFERPLEPLDQAYGLVLQRVYLQAFLSRQGGAPGAGARGAGFTCADRLRSLRLGVRRRLSFFLAGLLFGMLHCTARNGDRQLPVRARC